MTMKIRTFGFFARDVVNNIRRNSLMSLASVGSVIAVLVLMGVFLVFMMNIQYLADTVESTIELKAYLEDELEQDQIKAIEENIKTNKQIGGVELETKEQALKNFSEQIGQREDLMKGLEENNPLPNSFILKLKDPKDAEAVSEFLEDIEGVEEVKYGEEIVDKLLQSTYFARLITLILTIILTAVSIFIISNTIKLTVFARQREINIMKYVGATNWYVRWPFLMEGALLGLIGALFSTLVLGYGYYYFTGLTSNTMISVLSDSLIPASALMTQLTFFFIIMGIIIGALGSILSIRKFLKV
ncbi:permease-like cell division protein FtsX [Irregularibacter muris]|uniref:Cell division protein FtsX n=1 Tax=Irregularibacter muris TaxID=1796619 RepID=A0AAE3L2R1_9FIRM|nr:permease-like cell division protein FtsX [Irregularibacter muris]MCR1899084.1 permease-like cell division protein FtsX [Irregularibacter muris]